jgi:subtilase family serine protease
VAEFTEQFGPTQHDYQSVVDLARANGFEVTGYAANRLVVPISGTVDQVQRAFKVGMIVYQHPTEKRTFFSPDRNPSLALNVPIAHIAGLNNYSIPQSMAIKGSVKRSLDSTAVQGSGPEGSYLSSDMRAAYYGASDLTGSGQTVGLMQFDGYNISDVIASFGGTASATASGKGYVLTYTPTAGGATYTIPIENVLLDGATGGPGQFIPPANDAEQVLDIVQAVGMAPGLRLHRQF